MMLHNLDVMNLLLDFLDETCGYIEIPQASVTNWFNAIQSSTDGFSRHHSVLLKQQFAFLNVDTPSRTVIDEEKLHQTIISGFANNLSSIPLSTAKSSNSQTNNKLVWQQFEVVRLDVVVEVTVELSGIKHCKLTTADI